MSVICTVIWDIKPERKEEFVRALAKMFEVTKTHPGFISIRLMKSDTTDNGFLLFQEWETTQHHQEYVKFRDANGDLVLLADMTASETLIHYWDTTPLASA